MYGLGHKFACIFPPYNCPKSSLILPHFGSLSPFVKLCRLASLPHGLLHMSYVCVCGVDCIFSLM